MNATAEAIRVLHVDDDPDFSELAATYLEREDQRIEVLTAASTRAALDALDERDVDCVVSDYDMPDLKGIEFLEVVRERHGDLPFVLFTGKGSEEIASEAISAGVTDYLQKGTGTEQYALLANRIRNAVESDRTRRAFEDRNRRLETLISNLPGIVYRCRNAPEWPMEYVAGDCEAITGYTATDLEGGVVLWGTDVMHPADQQGAWDAVQDALDRGEPFETRYRIVTKDGATKRVWERGRGVYSADGELEALEGFITDFTEYAEREDVLKALHGIATEITTDETRDAVCRRTIEAAESVLDFDRCVINLEEDGTLPIVAISDGIPPDGVTTMSADEGIVGRTYRNSESVLTDDVRELEEANPQGPYRAAISVPIGNLGVFQAVSEHVGAFDEGDLELAELLVAHTAQALERLEGERELRQQNERLAGFASVVSHDLRNPLNVAQGRLRMAREERDSDHLAVVARAHDRMQRLIEDLLVLAREGETAIDVETVDLPAAIDESWGHVETKDARLEVEANGVVLADRGRLQQLLENLFRNAIEHGGPDVTVTVADLGTGFSVEDDGPGIPSEHRDRLFEAGYSGTDHGTGFGLAIVERIADAHGWGVTATEGRDGGARFELTGVKRPD
ncbi:response regulator [Halorarum halophilum]|uniref:histidine kinase n=1 Tax=Halorarum halophilum TaxID=2743090 RepID=A0A7D5KLT5_9EURY|nr:response regulator [Halobaculum halophilum]QLG27815.1 response regulator [Halobaculum halophilum]